MNQICSQYSKISQFSIEFFNWGTILTPILRGNSAMSDDRYFSCSNSGNATETYWVAAGDAVEHPTVCRAAPTIKTGPVQNAGSAEI